MKSSGVSTSTAIIGSSSTGFARRMPSLKRDRGRHLERVLVRVDLVVGAVEQRHLHVHDREAGEHAVRAASRRRPFCTAGMYSRGTDAALDRVDELEALAGLAAARP